VARLADRVLMMYAGQIVECATTGELFSSPAHPYARALLDCLPSLERVRSHPPTIPGNVPQPGNWPAGCRFADRCVSKAEGCEHPQRLEAYGGGGRLVRCHLAGELAKRTGGNNDE
jgi:oligopeptide/dipeptide ABC transporter ATP-binding protein